MCGIFAIWHYDGSPVDIQKVQRALSVIRHRGPDDEGYLLINTQTPQVMHCSGRDTDPRSGLSRIESFFDRHFDLVLGHRRLSILDLSLAGHQPLRYGETGLWIIHNGEVYNYLELKSELEGIGYRFESNTDTEVILAAYDAWGTDCLQHFNGMWAFIILDLKNKNLFISRDRFGIKPLYYWKSPQGFLAFSSEIKAFTVLPGWQARMNPQRVYDFLNWGLFDHSQETLFADVFQLRGGEVVELRFGDFQWPLPVYRWYELKPRPFNGTLDRAATTFKDLLRDSVRLRMRADVPAGSCLSGGLDSSSIVCIVNSILGEQNNEFLQNTFSACSTIERFDERDFIDEVVRITSVNVHYTFPSLEALSQDLENLAWHQDEPFGSLSIYAQWELFKLSYKYNVKVMLDGQGADELLAGYYDFFGPFFASLLKTFKWSALLREIRAATRVDGQNYVVAFKQMAHVLFPNAVVHALNRLVGHKNNTPSWLNMHTLNAKSNNPYVSLGAKGDTIKKLSFAQIVNTRLPMLLHWEDRNSMAHSIESRLPFLDSRLVEFVLGLPDDYKLSRGVTKVVLREGLRGMLPEPVRLRTDKMAFVTPEEFWLRKEAPSFFREKMKEAINLSQGTLNHHAILKLDRIISGKERFSFFPWRVISFGKWIGTFNVQL